jgi:hypothetical protein
VSAGTRQPPPPLVDHCRVPRTTEEADDYVWARRILAHVGDVARFVYGPRDRTIDRWDELSSYLDAWQSHRPTNFDPIWKSTDSMDEFPEMWFANDCHGRSHRVPVHPQQGRY